MASRQVLGFALGEHHDAALAYGALAMAVAVRGGQVPGVIFHSDRGSLSGSLASPVRYFGMGENKEQVGRLYIQAVVAEGGAGKVGLIGIAQEKTSVWRSLPTKSQQDTADP